MEDYKGTVDGAEFIKISPAAIEAGKGIKKWWQDTMARFSALSHSLFGYRRDPGRIEGKKVLSPLASMVVVRPNLKKAPLHGTDFER